jgi:hypothetical protein
MTPNTPPGPGVDASGQAVKDPTENVLDIVKAAIQRQDDLRAVEAVATRDRVDALERLVNAKLELIERQRVEQKADTEKAVQAALSAAKEAVKEQTTAFALATDKSERSMTEQLKQLNVTFTTAIGGAMDLLNDLKERVGKMESLKQGGREASSALYAFAGFVLVLLTLVGLILKYG